MRLPIAVAAALVSMRGPHGCVEPPTVETLIEARVTAAGLDALPHRGHIVLHDADDCVTMDERIQSRLFLNSSRSCFPGRLDVWENKDDGMAHVAVLILPHDNGTCAVEMFSDNTRVPGARPTSIHYETTLFEYSDCRGLGFKTTELDWWRIAPDGTPVPTAP